MEPRRALNSVHNIQIIILKASCILTSRAAATSNMIFKKYYVIEGCRNPSKGENRVCLTIAIAAGIAVAVQF